MQAFRAAMLIYESVVGLRLDNHALFKTATHARPHRFGLIMLECTFRAESRRLTEDEAKLSKHGGRAQRDSDGYRERLLG
ncbi:hypothetical protein AB9E09_09745 [Rhizobium leguminosarum]|uniref:hypothetical protein n=1 Tax=Rhizobium leguminosarum TaxID=384 RepID=UPI003F9C8A7A